MMEITFKATRDHLGGYPPVPAKKVIPQWYKDLPAELHPVTAQEMVIKGSRTPFSIKRCMPVLDFLTSGYVIRNETELMLSCNDDINHSVWWYSNLKDAASYHPHDQCPIQIKGSKKSYFKISTGYRVITPPGYSCLFYQSPYFFEERFTLFPAIVDTDDYDAEVLFPGFIHERKADILIEAGTPLLFVFPFKRDDWTIKLDLNKEDNGKKFKSKFANHVNNVYRRFFHKTKNYE
jgi:hypothetical protein